MSSLVEAVLYDAQPGTGDTTLFTVPAGSNYIISKLVIANATGTAATITLGRNGIAAANQFVPGVSIAANSSEFIDGPLVFTTGDTLHGLQGTASAITVYVSGAVHGL